MPQRGPHTWDFLMTYHRCPHCGYVQSSQQVFVKRLGLWQKEITCLRCKKGYTALGRPYKEPDTLY